MKVTLDLYLQYSCDTEMHYMYRSVQIRAIGKGGGWEHPLKECSLVDGA